MYVLIKNNQVEHYQYSISQLRRDNPGTSFPQNPSSDLLASWGVYPVKKVSSPAHDPMTQKIREGTPELVDSEWTQTWILEELSESEISDISQKKASSIRAERNQKLAETDWVVTASLEKEQEIPSDWKIYRQALRDITEQQGFPFDIVWPSEPSN
jgi:hypothetical protein